MWAFLAHVLGVDDVSGRWYAWWSGFAGDLSSFALFGGAYALIRRHNCDVHGCWRLGVLPTDVGGMVHHVCKRHHPGAPTADDVCRAADAPGSADT
jgi:hypothetical protein